MHVPVDETLTSQPFGYRDQELPPKYAQLAIGVITQRVPAVTPQMQISKLLARYMEHPELPVVNRQKKLLALLGEHDALLASEGWTIPDKTLPILKKTDTLADAQALFNAHPQSIIPILDDQGRYTGHCASRQKLRDLYTGRLRPERVGGLATPLGVYLTSGYHMAGSGIAGLVATGILFAVITRLIDWGSVIGLSALWSVYPQLNDWPPFLVELSQVFAMLFILLTLLRFSPMSGLHAAEHMTINAIELNLPVEEKTVRHQDRVHQRCGTNLMVLILGLQLAGFSIFALSPQLNWLGIFLYSWISLFFVLKYWMPAGLWIQENFTTRRPFAWELRSGVRAGEELLQKFQDSPHANPGFLRKLWGSGMLHMLLSFLIASWLIEQALWALLAQP